MEPQIIVDQNYAPGTPLSYYSDVPVEYDMTGKTVVFELEKNDVVIFRVSDASSEVDITGQEITIGINPATASEDAIGNTFAEAMAMACRQAGSDLPVMNFNLDIGPSGGPVDIRAQGNLIVYPEHGDSN